MCGLLNNIPMPISEAEYQMMQRRLEQGPQDPEPTSEAVSREIEELHKPIIKWCMSQIPAVPFVYHRPDKKSGITEGACDFFIFLKRHVMCIECKSKTGKRSSAQLAFAYLMQRQGFIVHDVRSMAEFHAAVAVTLMDLPS